LKQPRREVREVAPPGLRTHLPVRLEGDAPGKIDAVRKY
jgi:hypothetical protein